MVLKEAIEVPSGKGESRMLSKSASVSTGSSSADETMCVELSKRYCKSCRIPNRQLCAKSSTFQNMEPRKLEELFQEWNGDNAHLQEKRIRVGLISFVFIIVINSPLFKLCICILFERGVDLHSLLRM